MHGANTFVLIIDFYKFNSLISVGFLFFLIEKNSYQIEILKKYENGKKHRYQTHQMTLRQQTEIK